MVPDVGHLEFDTLAKIALALGIGLLVGLERQRARKDVGLRTFSLTALAGLLGWLISPAYSIAVLAAVVVIIVVLNVHEMIVGEPVQVTTSIAMIVTTILGVIIGQGQVLVPVAAGILMTVLLAWRDEMVGWAVGLAQNEVRSALTLGILMFVIYPALPPGYVDPWSLVNIQAMWLTVILVATIGFGNYILLRLYGSRGLAYTSLLGGLVNSTVTAAELAIRGKAAGKDLAGLVFRGVILANAAMLFRNGVLLTILSPDAALAAAVPLSAMLVASLVIAFWGRWPSGDASIELASPFSVMQALRFGLIFLAITVTGDLAMRVLGQVGFYVVSLVGGMVSSASAVATAATLATQGKLLTSTAAIGAVIASIASGVIHLGIVWRVGGDVAITLRLLWATLLIAAIGVAALLPVLGLVSAP